MKNICVTILLFFYQLASAQITMPITRIQAGINKTTNIIFPAPIIKADLGSADITGQVVEGADTILQIKALKKDFPETNISVITADGKLHCFLVDYSADPLSVSISDYTKKDYPLNKFWLAIEREKIANQKTFLHKGISSDDIDFVLKGVYIDGAIIWFRFLLRNHSFIDFHPSYIRFYLKDRHKAKRSPAQMFEIRPVFIDEKVVVPGEKRRHLHVAFPAFTIPKGKKLLCEISEEDGSRRLALTIKHRALLKAHIPDR